MLSAASIRFSQNKLRSQYDDEISQHINMPPNLSLPWGTWLSLIPGSANDSQILAITGATGGTFTIIATMYGLAQTTASLAYNSTAGQVQTALQALGILGANVTVTGSAGGPWTVSANNLLAGTPIPSYSANIALLTPAPPTSAFSNTRVTTGRTAGTYTQYTGLIVSPPSTPPVPTSSATAGTIGAGTFLISYTLLTAFGESTPSPTAAVTLTSLQSISIAAITGLNAAVTGVNFYINGQLSANVTVTANATAVTVISALSTTLEGDAPNVNYANPLPVCLLEYDTTTDANGKVSMGLQNGGGQWGEKYDSAKAFFSGDFATADMKGFDQNAVNMLTSSRFIAGNFANGGIFRLT